MPKVITPQLFDELLKEVIHWELDKSPSLFHKGTPEDVIMHTSAGIINFFAINRLIKENGWDFFNSSTKYMVVRGVFSLLDKDFSEYEDKALEEEFYSSLNNMIQEEEERVC